MSGSRISLPVPFTDIPGIRSRNEFAQNGGSDFSPESGAAAGFHGLPGLGRQAGSVAEVKYGQVLTPTGR